MRTHMDTLAIIHSKLVWRVHTGFVVTIWADHMCCQDMSLPTYSRDESLDLAQVVMEDKALCKVQRKVL